jgi:hypothetical protein
MFGQRTHIICQAHMPHGLLLLQQRRSSWQVTEHSRLDKLTPKFLLVKHLLVMNCTLVCLNYFQVKQLTKQVLKHIKLHEKLQNEPVKLHGQKISGGTCANPYHSVTHCYNIGLATNLIKCLPPWWLNMQAEQGYGARSYSKKLMRLPLNSETKTSDRQTSAAI